VSQDNRNGKIPKVEFQESQAQLKMEKVWGRARPRSRTRQNPHTCARGSRLTIRSQKTPRLMDSQIVTRYADLQGRGCRVDEAQRLRRNILREDDESLCMI
jgi:hypothetical protein